MKTKTIHFILLLTISFFSIQAFSSNDPDKKLIHESFAVKKTTRLFDNNRQKKFNLMSPVIKYFNPQTYIKFTLKNKKGTFLNIKIGYIG